MGVGLFIEASIPSHESLHPQRPTEEHLTRLAEAIVACIDDPMLREHTLIVRRSEDSLDIALHPAAEPVEIYVEEGVVRCSAKTSTAGPGYHAFVVELLEQVGPRAGLVWRWTDGDGEPGDETGFHAHRDFEAVERSMLDWLRAVSVQLTEVEGSELGLNMPVGFTPVRPGEVTTPLGPFDLPRFHRAASSDHELRALAIELFPWWGRRCDAAFWLGYARALAWTEVAWHVPRDAHETRIVERTLAAFDRVQSLDPAAPLPTREVAELRALSSPDAYDALAPAPEGIGYRRGPFTWWLPGDWSVSAPGFWYEDRTDKEHVLWFDERTIRATAYKLEKTLAALVELAEQQVRDHGSADIVRFATDTGTTIGSVRFCDEDGGYFMLQGYAVAEDALCSITLCYCDDEDRAWAEATLQSFKHPPSTTKR